jgi:hypothetical protein
MLAFYLYASVEQKWFLAFYQYAHWLLYVIYAYFNLFMRLVMFHIFVRTSKDGGKLRHKFLSVYFSLG